MAPQEPLHRFARAAVERISWMKGEPSWMTEHRLAAWNAFETLSPPDLGGLDLEILHAFTEVPRTTVPSHEWPEDLQSSLDERGDEEGLIIQRDSTVLSRAMTKEQAKKGVIFTDMDTAVKAVPDLVRRYWGTQLRADDAFGALNTAFWSGGAFLYVPPHVDVQLPFHICYWMSQPHRAIFPRSIIVAEGGSLVSFIDEQLSGSWPEPGLSLGIAEIVVREKAQVRYYNLQNCSPSVYHENRFPSSVSRSGTLLSFQALMGGSRQPHRVTLETLRGETRQTFNAAVGSGPMEAIDTVLQHLPNEPIKEKLRHYVIGKITGRRPPLTLERMAELYPEVR